MIRLHQSDIGKTAVLAVISVISKHKIFLISQNDLIRSHSGICNSRIALFLQIHLTVNVDMPSLICIVSPGSPITRLMLERPVVLPFGLNETTSPRFGEPS